MDHALIRPQQGSASAGTHVGWVDYAKGIGIILVVYGHVSNGVNNAGIPFPQLAFQPVYDVIYSFHMPLFFFLAGLFFLHSWQRRGPAGLLQSKIDTIVYPYLLWSLVQGSVETMLARYTNNHASFDEFLSLLWLPPRQFWFLYAMFLIFVLASVAYSLLPQRWRPLMLVAAAIAFLFRNDVPNFAALSYVAGNAVFFFLGIALRRLGKRSSAPGTALLLAGLLAFAGAQIALLVWIAEFDPIAAGIPRLLVAVVSIGFVVLCSQWLAAHRAQKWLALVGAHSLAIYLLHTFFAAGTRIALDKVLHLHLLPLHLLAGTAAGVLLPLAISVWVERNRIQGVFSMPRQWRLARAAPGDESLSRPAR